MSCDIQDLAFGAFNWHRTYLTRAGFSLTHLRIQALDPGDAKDRGAMEELACLPQVRDIMISRQLKFGVPAGWTCAAASNKVRLRDKSGLRLQNTQPFLDSLGPVPAPHVGKWLEQADSKLRSDPPPALRAAYQNRRLVYNGKLMKPQRNVSVFIELDAGEAQRVLVRPAQQPNNTLCVARIEHWAGDSDDALTRATNQGGDHNQNKALRIGGMLALFVAPYQPFSSPNMSGDDG